VKSVATGLVLIGLAVCGSGCQFYSVSGKESNKDFLTLNWACQHNKDKGTARFKDLKTGKEVRLTGAEMMPVPFDEAFAELAVAASNRPR
jgi:hypothetical protein